MTYKNPLNPCSGLGGQYITLSIFAIASIPLFDVGLASEIKETYPIEVKAVTDGTTVWKVESKTFIRRSYGSYKYGPIGMGPGIVSMEKGKVDSYTNSLTGNYSSKLNVGISLGTIFGKSYSEKVAYSIQPPAGVRYQLKGLIIITIKLLRGLIQD